MRTIIAERKRPRTDNEQTISPESAYAGCKPGPTRTDVRQARVDPDPALPGARATADYQEAHGRFQPLSPFDGSSVSFLIEFFTTTTSPTIEPA